jgi:hypothetical protein
MVRKSFWRWSAAAKEQRLPALKASAHPKTTISGGRPQASSSHPVGRPSMLTMFVSRR